MSIYLYVSVKDFYEYNVRWAIENNYPPLMIYGTTTMDWGINLGRHIPFIDDCLVCRYPEKKENIQYVCSEGKLYDPKQEDIDAALPFLSPLAAILIVAEVIKAQLKGYPFNEDFAFLDFKGKTEKILKYQRKPKRNCFCRNKNEDIFWCYNEFTKYAFLSKKKKCFA